MTHHTVSYISCQLRWSDCAGVYFTNIPLLFLFQFEDYEMDLVCLKFIKTVCGCRGNIPNICGAKMFQKMWNALINMLTALSGHHSQEVMTSSNSVHLTTREVMTSLASLEESSVCDLNPVGQSGVTDLKTDQWRTRQAALLDTVTIAMSCDLDEFKSVLTGLVNDMVGICYFNMSYYTLFHNIFLFNNFII